MFVMLRKKLCFFFKFCGNMSQSGGATGTLCFGLWLTLPIGFKARVDGGSSESSLGLSISERPTRHRPRHPA